MNWANFPSLNGLRAFAEVAKAQSYTRAAAALNISHSAVSQQVKSLEARLGITLVEREGRELRLTEDGAALASQLARGLATIREGVEALTLATTSRPIHVTTSPAFAASWLMPRLPDFQCRHPDITFKLHPTAELIDPSPNGVDLAIRYGKGEWPNFYVSPLLLPEMVVVGAHTLVGNSGKLDPAVALGLPWLQELGTDEVEQWMKRRGLSAPKPVKVLHMPGNLIMEGVRRGDGLTFTALCFVEKEIQSGTLVVLSSERDLGGYYLITRSGTLRTPVKTFVKWLKRQSKLLVLDGG